MRKTISFFASFIVVFILFLSFGGIVYAGKGDCTSASSGFVVTSKNKCKDSGYDCGNMQIMSSGACASLQPPGCYEESISGTNTITECVLTSGQAAVSTEECGKQYGEKCCVGDTECYVGYPVDTKGGVLNMENTCYCQAKPSSNNLGSLESVFCDSTKTSIKTAIGCINISTQTGLLSSILKWAIGIGGGIAFILVIFASFSIMTSQGNPDRLQAGRELLTSAIAGLILLILSIFILKFVGVDFLGLSKFGFGAESTTTIYRK